MSTRDVMCKQCCAYPSHTCICPPRPTQPVNALAVLPKQSMSRKRRGMLRVIATDVKNATTNLTLRGWFTLGNAIRAVEDRIKKMARGTLNTVQDVYKHPLYHTVNALMILSVPCIIGIFILPWWTGSALWDGRGLDFESSPKGLLKQWETNQKIILSKKLNDYIKSVYDRSNEEVE